MLDNVQLENYKVVGKGSVYPVKSGKQTLGLAFYYSKKNEKDKKRKVVLGNAEEELENKALTFLKKMDMETMEERGVEKQEGTYINIEERQAEIQKDIHFREVAAEWLAEYAERRHATKKQISYSSVESRACSLKKINQYIGDVPVKDIDNDMAEKLIDQCSVKEDGTYYSESHVDKLQQAFLLVMEYATNKG